MQHLSLSNEAKFLQILKELIEITESFDQLNKLALLADLLYDRSDPVYTVLYHSMEAAARHLRNLPSIGFSEIKEGGK